MSCRRQVNTENSFIFHSLQEPVQKKMYPLPASPTSETSGEKNTFDEDYSDWVPPTGKST